MTKKDILKVARKGNFAANRSDQCELACQSCGRYAFENEHEDDCPVGELLRLIEESNLE